MSTTIEFKDIKHVPQGAPFNENAIQPTSPAAIVGNDIQRVSATLTQSTEDTTVGGITEKSVTTYGENFDLFRTGKDVKTINQFYKDSLLSPNISLGKAITSDDKHDIDYSLGHYNLGQNRAFSVIDKNTKKLLPVIDMEGRPTPSSFLMKSHSSLSGFPYVYNKKGNIGHYTNPEIASINGAIDVFHVRSSHISSGINDIYFRGAKGLFGAGNWILTQNTTRGKKGSSFMSDQHQVAITKCDFFEDSQSVVLEKSIGGYISEGVNVNSPYKDDDKFASYYTHLTIAQRINLLVSSSRNDSELGTSFKSRENGFMITPFYQKNEKRSFGKDSIAFNGLLKR